MTPEDDAVDAVVEQWARERPELDTASVEVFGRIYRIADGMAARIEDVCARFGVSRGEYDVLATLRRSGEPFTLSPKRLAAATMLTTGGMTNRLDRLERLGLVGRSPDPHDRRGLRVTLTDEGRAVVDRAFEAGLEEQRQVLGTLAPKRVAELRNLLRDLLASVDTAPASRRRTTRP